MKDGQTFILDFDNTCTESDFPRIGEEIHGCVPVLKALIEHGHRLILWSMRSDKKTIDPGAFGDSRVVMIPGNYLEQSLKWFKEREIHIWSVYVDPGQHLWTDSTKPYGHVIIDDTALGIPLTKGKKHEVVDWAGVYTLLVARGYLKYNRDLYNFLYKINPHGI